METVERPKGAACPEPVGEPRNDAVATPTMAATGLPPEGEEDYFFWGINEFYVPP